MMSVSVKMAKLELSCSPISKMKPLFNFNLVTCRFTIQIFCLRSSFSAPHPSLIDLKYSFLHRINDDHLVHSLRLPLHVIYNEYTSYLVYFHNSLSPELPVLLSGSSDGLLQDISYFVHPGFPQTHSLCGGGAKGPSSPTASLSLA